MMNDGDRFHAGRCDEDEAVIRCTDLTVAYGDEVVLEIADDGVGSPKANLEKIFNLGFSTKGGAGGAGIGLALSDRIVREHAGTIEVASTPGEGTTFTVRLPSPPPDLPEPPRRS